MAIHCVAHRLALAANRVSSVKQFKNHLNSLFTYFHRSPKCSGHLEATFMQLFNKPALKLKKPSDTRWLACDEAVKTLKKILEPLTITIENMAASEESDATVVGLAGLLSKYSFVAAVFFMSEILPTLSKVFQTENLPFTSVKPAIESAKSTIHSLHSHTKSNTADWQKELRTALINTKPMEFYATFVKPFIEAVLGNLEDRFPEEDVAVISAAKIFDPGNIDQSTVLYSYGRNEITTLAEHYKLEKEALVSEWKDFNDKLLRYSNAEAVLTCVRICSLTFSTSLLIYW